LNSVVASLLFRGHHAYSSAHETNTALDYRASNAAIN